MRWKIWLLYGFLATILGIATFGADQAYRMGARAEAVAESSEATAKQAAQLVQAAQGELREQKTSRVYIEKAMDEIRGHLKKLDRVSEDVAELKGMHKRDTK